MPTESEPSISWERADPAELPTRSRPWTPEVRAPHASHHVVVVMVVVLELLVLILSCLCRTS